MLDQYLNSKIILDSERSNEYIVFTMVCIHYLFFMRVRHTRCCVSSRQKYAMIINFFGGFSKYIGSSWN